VKYTKGEEERGKEGKRAREFQQSRDYKENFTIKSSNGQLREEFVASWGHPGFLALGTISKGNEIAIASRDRWWIR
jgi:hypothetical protein